MGRWANSQGGYIEDGPDYKNLQRSNLEMAASYFNAYLRYLRCEVNNHKWSPWNAFVSSRGNLRVCIHCYLEMPESRKGQKNYKEYEGCDKCGRTDLSTAWSLDFS